MTTARERLEELRAIDATATVDSPVNARARLEQLRELDAQEVDLGQELVEELPEGNMLDGIADMFTGSERIDATPELGTLPEFGTTEEGDTPRIALGMLSTFNPKAQQDIIQEAIPEAVFEITPDGSTIIEVPTENGGIRRSVLNRPGFSPQDLTTATAQVLSFIPAARLAGLGKTLLQKVGLGAVAAGATEQALQETGISLGRKERDPTETAIAAGGGAVGELLGAGVQAYRGAKQARKTGVEQIDIKKAVESLKPVNEAVDAVQDATGQPVGLFQAQQTQVPSQLLKQRILPQLDAGSRIASDALEIQNKQVFAATAELINTIAPEGVIPTASKQFKNAAEKSLKAAKDSRRLAVKPFYDIAFRTSKEKGFDLDLNPVIDFVNDEIVNLVDDDPAKIALASFIKRLQGEAIEAAPGGAIAGLTGDQLIPAAKTTTKPLTLQRLQSAKFTTDAKIDKMAGLNPNSATKNAKRLLIKAEKIYLEQLGKISPEFAEANAEFARLSPAVTALEDSIIGQVTKIKDSNLKTIAQRIFDPKTSLTDPASIEKARKVINAVDSEAWDNLLRVEINRRLGGLSQLVEEIPGDFVGNIPGQLRRSLFGNPQQRKALLAGMSKEQKQNFNYLETVLKRASSGRAAGSPTAAFGQVVENLRGVSLVIRDSIFKPLKSLKEIGERSTFDKNVAALSRVMFDPKYKPQLTKLKELDQNTPAAARAMTQLLRQAAEQGQETEEDTK